MNKRIQELAEQCYEHDQSWTGVGQRIFNKEKFAELIIRGCARKANATALDLRNNPDLDGRKYVGNSILKCFGVDE